MICPGLGLVGVVWCRWERAATSKGRGSSPASDAASVKILPGLPWMVRVYRVTAGKRGAGGWRRDLADAPG